MSYLAGTKLAMIKLNQGKNLSREDRSGLYEVAKLEAARLDSEEDVIIRNTQGSECRANSVLKNPAKGLPRRRAVAAKQD
jgi:hypothetical protein